jgi:Protein of unknown function DUF262
MTNQTAASESDEVHEDTILDFDESSEVIPYRYHLTAYGADYPVDGLVMRLQKGDIKIPTFDPDVGIEGIEGFQREFVWTKPQADRFVESLLLGLPVPGIFLVKQDDGTYLVLDGQQRLLTLQAFYQGVFRRREFSLEDVQSAYTAKTYKTLDIEDRRRLDNSIIHATIVQQDEPTENMSSVYLIFERLNTGGTKLTPHEIRVALHGGSFARLLRDLEGDENWSALVGGKKKHLKGQELILRFLALLYTGDAYQSPMKEFLNSFMASNKSLQLHDEQSLRAIFKRTTSVILHSIGNGAFRLGRAVNAAVVDSVMVAIARRINQDDGRDGYDFREAHLALLANTNYRDAVERATAREEQVKQRIRLATKAFSVLG